MGVTAPWVLQSQVAGMVTVERTNPNLADFLGILEMFNPLNRARNSSFERSENSLCPTENPLLVGKLVINL